MAENFEFTPGTGATGAADDIAGVKYPKVKLTGGGADDTTMVEAGGGVEAGALRVTIASDSTGVISIDDNGGAITVDGTVTANLGATDNAVLDAIQAAVEVLDNIVSGSEAQVDVVTVPAPLNVVGTGTEATALRVTIASDSTGVISIDDNGGTITVDGTVTANLGATDNAVLDAIQAAVEIIDNAISGTEMQVDIASALPAGDNNIGNVDIVSGTVDTVTTITNVVHVDDNAGSITVDNAGLTELAAAIDTELQVDVVASLPAGTNAIGKLAANSGVDIGDVDVLSIAAGETHIGEVGLPDDTITITCTVDTSAYADGDVLFATQEIANAVRVNGDTCILQSVHVIDIDDQGIEMDLVFFNANTSLGTENAAPDIDDTEVLTTLGYVNVADYIDLGANRIATVTGIGLALEAGAATTSLWVAGITRGTPTHSATGLTIKFGFLRN